VQVQLSAGDVTRLTLLAGLADNVSTSYIAFDSSLILTLR
jgi:hypothetical protein